MKCPKCQADNPPSVPSKMARCVACDRQWCDDETTGVYGKCPHCGADGVSRERRLNGNDKCVFGHIYASKDAVLCPHG